MHKATCTNTFKMATNERRKCPLPHGGYKLREYGHRLGRIEQDLVTIRLFVSTGRRDALYSCTYEDKATWLKDLPTLMAYRLGYDLIPSFLALPADGVPQLVIASLEPEINERVNDLLAELELVRQRITKNIGLEYDRMRFGDPMLEPLVYDALRLAELALNLTPKSTPPRPTAHGVL